MSSADHGHSELGEMDLRVRALDAIIDTYQIRVGPRNGARVVAPYLV